LGFVGTLLLVGDLRTACPRFAIWVRSGPGKACNSLEIKHQTIQSEGCRIGRSNDFDFRFWHKADMARCLLFGRYQGESGHSSDIGGFTKSISGREASKYLRRAA